MADQGQNGTKEGSLIYFILFIIFLIPILLAGYLFFHKEHMQAKTTNYGHLIQPPFSINLLKIYNQEGRLLDPQALASARAITNGKWLLLLIAPSNCNTACLNGLYNMRQIRLATGAQRQRVERAVLSFKNAARDDQLENLLQTKYVGTQHFYADKAEFMKVFGEYRGFSNDLKQGVIYVLDPRGTVMMSYQPNASPTKVFKDVQRLLKVSQIG